MLSSKQRTMQSIIMTTSLIALATSVSSEAKESLPFDKINLGTIGYNGPAPISQGEKYKKSKSIHSSNLLNNKPYETKAHKKHKRKLSAVSRKANRKK